MAIAHIRVMLQVIACSAAGLRQHIVKIGVENQQAIIVLKTQCFATGFNANIFDQAASIGIAFATGIRQMW